MTSEPPSWRPYFGFETPYENQADAIETAISTVRSRGYLAMEGPCGTGKTMAALTAAATLVRETDDFENVFVATPVKQQRQQFIEDLRTINRGLETPLSGVALVGKRDLCPYGREGLFPDSTSVQSRCEDLRETTADLVSADESAGSADTDDNVDPAGESPEPSAAFGGTDADPWWDVERARSLVETARRDLTAAQDAAAATDGSASASATPLRTAGASAPYGRSQPAAPEGFTESESTPLYCPFEADWYAREKGSPIGFERGIDHVLSAREFLPATLEAGTCPHRAMGVLLEHAEVVIGNYNHLFDGPSRQLTEAILDERTVVVVDEAHRLEERVRDLLSDTIGRVTLAQARRDLGVVLERARQHPDNRQRIEAILAESDVPYAAVERAHQFYGEALTWLDERVEAELAERFDGYAAGYTDDLPADRLEIELQDPDGEEPDDFTTWAEEEAGYDASFVRTLVDIGSAVENTLNRLSVEREPVCAATGVRFEQWWNRDHTAFFRELTLEPSDGRYRNPDYPWRDVYNASFVMYNCIPAEAVRSTLAEFGGGVLMSATLEPIDIFETVSGLRALSTRQESTRQESTQEESTRQESTATDADDTRARQASTAADADSTRARQAAARRTVERRSYELQFPSDHRESWVVDVMAFTARNRGEPVDENRNRTRERYAYVAREIARSHGNILLCYPNYAEAAWAAGRLRETVDKPVFRDESSSHEATQSLKAKFLDSEHAVLVTSTRGTLTEGVDFDGESLHTCAVFGVPLVNIGSPRVQAVKYAYGERFGRDNAFEYALTVPAIRQVRQAIGRVIRGPDERGVRVLVGERYVPGRPRSVTGLLSPQEQREFSRLTPEYLAGQFEAFWDE